MVSGFDTVLAKRPNINYVGAYIRILILFSFLQCRGTEIRYEVDIKLMKIKANSFT